MYARVCALACGQEMQAQHGACTCSVIWADACMHVYMQQAGHHHVQSPETPGSRLTPALYENAQASECNMQAVGSSIQTAD